MYVCMYVCTKSLCSRSSSLHSVHTVLITPTTDPCYDYLLLTTTITSTATAATAAAAAAITTALYVYIHIYIHTYIHTVRLSAPHCPLLSVLVTRCVWCGPAGLD